MQALQEKAQIQQRKLQEKQDAKEQKEKQRKEKLHQQQQLKEQKQQLSRSNSHLSLLSQQSGSMSMGDGSTTPRSENRSSMGDQRDGADVVIKMEPQVRNPPYFLILLLKFATIFFCFDEQVCIVRFIYSC